MSSQSLQAVWDASAGREYQPMVGKDSQFAVGSNLLVLALVLIGLFGLNPSLKNLVLCGLPASVALGFGAVYMICAVGVYV